MSALLQNLPKLRPMCGIDLDSVMEIEKSIYPYPWTHGNFTDSLTAGYSCWITECADEIAAYGVLMMGVKEAHLLNLSVAIPWQRSGMGNGMLQHFVAIAKDMGAEMLLLEVRPSNVPARALYQRAGFSELTTRRNYYPAAQGKEDAILMGLVL